MLQTRWFHALTAAATLTVFLLPAHRSATAQANRPPSRTPVLVELFTAEGCSSCPPADDLLAQLESQQPVAGVDIIVLGEHVDYWDKLGWRDRFSSPQYTERQHDYGFRFKLDDIYTPQMVVDGTQQFVGNDAPHALRAIAHAGQTSKIALVLAKPVVDGHKVKIIVSTPIPSPSSKADLYAAVVDVSDTTSVGGGENRGRELHHVAVVRSLQRIGKLENLNSKPIEATLTAPPDANPKNVSVVVFAQSSGPGQVIGVTYASAEQ
ncbi:DUF1223 domain-containing protein [Edaphobacter paludis]|uniref:DUF1223 domain-containing protein n=1 Tax=Edaphobacter paludis TaxID=3035702 RepID=A0AAU7D1B2_9BACT